MKSKYLISIFTVNFICMQLTFWFWDALQSLTQGSKKQSSI